MPIEALYVFGLLLIVGAMAYGIFKSRTRNRANDPIRETATEQLYSNPEGYEHGGKQALDRKLKPES